MAYEGSAWITLSFAVAIVGVGSATEVAQSIHVSAWHRPEARQNRGQQLVALPVRAYAVTGIESWA